MGNNGEDRMIKRIQAEMLKMEMQLTDAKKIIQGQARGMMSAHKNMKQMKIALIQALHKCQGQVEFLQKKAAEDYNVYDFEVTFCTNGRVALKLKKKEDSDGGNDPQGEPRPGPEAGAAPDSGLSLGDGSNVLRLRQGDRVEGTGEEAPPVEPAG